MLSGRESVDAELVVKETPPPVVKETPPPVVKKMPHPVDTYVGRRMKFCRVIKGMSQEDLGKAVGITFQQVQKYEKGNNRVGASRLYQFSKVLEVQVGYFFSGVDADIGHDNCSMHEVLDNHAGRLHDNREEFKYDKLSSESENIVVSYKGKEVLSLIKAYSSIKDQTIRNKILSLIKTLSPGETDDIDLEE